MRRPALLALLVATALGGCSVRQYALSRTADTLATSGTSFATDDDPELIQEARPRGARLRNLAGWEASRRSTAARRPGAFASSGPTPEESPSWRSRRRGRASTSPSFPSQSSSADQGPRGGPSGSVGPGSSPRNPEGPCMARVLRWADTMTSPRRLLPGTTYFVTRRCLDRQFLLRPSKAGTHLRLPPRRLPACPRPVAHRGPRGPLPRTAPTSCASSTAPPAPPPADASPRRPLLPRTHRSPLPSPRRASRQRARRGRSPRAGKGELSILHTDEGQVRRWRREMGPTDAKVGQRSNCNSPGQGPDHHRAVLLTDGTDGTEGYSLRRPGRCYPSPMAAALTELAPEVQRFARTCAASGAPRRRRSAPTWPTWPRTRPTCRRAGGALVPSSPAAGARLPRQRRQRPARSPLARKLSTVRSFYRFLVKEGLATSNPARAVPGAPPPEAAPRGPARGGRGGAGRGSRRDPGPLGLRDRAFLELLYSCGLRVSELTGLDLDDLDLAEGLVRVLGKGSKERVVPVGGPAREALRRWIEEGRAALLAGADGARRPAVHSS